MIFCVLKYKKRGEIMSKTKKIVYTITSSLIVLFALAFCILDWKLKIDFGYHPILSFLFVIFAGFGIVVLVLAFQAKSPWFFFTSAIMVGLSVFYVMFYYTRYWVAIIVTVGIWALFAILSIVICGNTTENIALNKSPDYKDYKQRRAEKLEAEANKPEEELPEIKSFKK